MLAPRCFSFSKFVQAFLLQRTYSVSRQVVFPKKIDVDSEFRPGRFPFTEVPPPKIFLTVPFIFDFLGLFFYFLPHYLQIPISIAAAGALHYLSFFFFLWFKPYYFPFPLVLIFSCMSCRLFSTCFSLFICPIFRAKVFGLVFRHLPVDELPPPITLLLPLSSFNLVPRILLNWVFAAAFGRHPLLCIFTPPPFFFFEFSSLLPRCSALVPLILLGPNTADCLI